MVALSLLAHIHWFDSLSVLTYDDWHTQTIQEGIRMFSWPAIWDTRGLGSINLNSSFFPNNFLIGGMAWLGFGFNISERLIFMLPITVFAPLGSYFLAKQIVKRDYAAAAGAIVYTFNTYFLLVQTRHLTIAAAYAIAPVVLGLFIRLCRQPRVKTAVYFGFVAYIMGIYDFRILYIALFACSFYLISDVVLHIHRKEFKKWLASSRLIILGFSIPILLNLYWLIGLSKTGSLSSNELFNRALFGNDILNLQYAMAFFLPFWNGTKPVWFLLHQIPFYFWVVPAMAFAAIALRPSRKQTMFFAALALLGILLTKQASAPFTGLYLWLYIHFPGFSAFREASKFFVLIGLGYSVLIAIFIDGIVEKASVVTNQNVRAYRIVGFASGAFLLALTLVIIHPYISRDIGSLFVPRQIPVEYVQLNNLELSQNAEYRILWLPGISRWSLTTNNIHNLDGQFILRSQNIDQNTEELYSNEIKKGLKNSIFEKIAGNVGIKYFIVPIRDTSSDDDFYKNFGDDRSYYVRLLDTVPWLQRVDLVEGHNLAIFENKNYKAHSAVAKDVVAIPGTSGIDNLHSFLNNTLKLNDFNFKKWNASRSIKKLIKAQVVPNKIKALENLSDSGNNE